MRRRSKGFKPKGKTASSGISADERLSNGRGVFTTWLREYRFLAIVLGLWLLLGIYELSRTDLPRSSEAVPPEFLLDERVNLTKTLVELYPQRSTGYFLRAYQAGMCFERGFSPVVCSTFTHKDLRDVRIALEEALARGGAKNEEGLFHFYAFILCQLDESPEIIDQAIRQWRKHYPNSIKPDPRELPRANSAPGNL